MRRVLRDVLVESPAAALAGGATRGTVSCVSATMGEHELGVVASPTEMGVLVGDRDGVGESMEEGGGTTGETDEGDGTTRGDMDEEGDSISGETVDGDGTTMGETDNDEDET